MFTVITGISEYGNNLENIYDTTHPPLLMDLSLKKSQKHVQVTFNPKIIGGKNIIIYYIFNKYYYLLHILLKICIHNSLIHFCNLNQHKLKTLQQQKNNFK